MRKKILVVEDNVFTLEFMVDVLTKEGHQVLTAEDGLSALEILKTCSPDVIFVDLIMPNIEGKKLCKIIRRMPALDHSLVVILSAVAAEEAIELDAWGADAFIAKGPLETMKKNILTVLDRSKRQAVERPQERILGVERVFPRAITKELLSTKRHFETVLGSMAEGVMEITAKGRIVYANPAALSLVGVPEEELLGTDIVGLFCESDRRIVKALIQKLRTGPVSVADEHAVDLKGKQVLLSVVPLTGEDDRAIVILNDVTERKRIESQLLMAQKMEAIGTLASGIAHDFNNLLTNILHNASMLQLENNAAQPQHEKITNIERLAKSGSKLTRQLLGYVKNGRYEVTSINLNLIVADHLETFGKTRRGIAAHRNLAEDLLEIGADQGQIEQVLFNLCVNAADAMPEGGELTVSTRNVSRQEINSHVYNAQPGNYVLLTISDTGAGMDEETVKHIFEPFFTTKKLGRGTGLGLAWVYGIIKTHGGYINAESVRGKETTFRVYLPAAEGEIDEIIARDREKRLIPENRLALGAG